MLGIHVSEGTAEGWFGQGKTSAILSIIVFVALIGGIAFGIFAAVNVFGGTDVSQPGTPTAPSSPAPSGSADGTIQVPDGPKVKVSFEGPPELEMVFNKLGVENFEFYIDGTLKNVSETTIIIGTNAIAFFVDGKQEGVLFAAERTLKPGESWRIQKGFGTLITQAEEVVVRVVNFRRVEAQAPTQTPEPVKPPPLVEGDTYTFYMNDYPKNPREPAEVIATFYGLLLEEKYIEALKLMDAGYREYPRAEKELERLWKTGLLKDFAGRPVERIEIQLTFSGEDYASTKNITWFFVDGTSESIASIVLQRTDGVWEISA